uniref:ATP synthase F0 subunit 8 n=1 Tax=Macrohectopus branickii TaxID=65455 RepID=UPI001D0F8A0C|nr:ATP synthase F0 subunit 8 [Macrohectopus branickii]UCL27453.1 ATP synthase F0 subunit 8 [Macrohectopus branickii]
MPQMAPVLWSPIFFTLTCLLICTKTFLYFYITKTPKLSMTFKVSGLVNNWLW